MYSIGAALWHVPAKKLLEVAFDSGLMVSFDNESLVKVSGWLHKGLDVRTGSLESVQLACDNPKFAISGEL